MGGKKRLDKGSFLQRKVGDIFLKQGGVGVHERGVGDFFYHTYDR